MCTVKKGKKFWWNLDIWGKFYEGVCGWQAISNRQEEVNKRGKLKIK